MLQQFVAAIGSGQTDGLMQLLSADAIAYADGGGVRISALNPILGRTNVARFYMGLARKFVARGGEAAMQMATLNTRPALLIHINGKLDQALSIDIRDGLISRVYTVRNPEKLTRVDTDPTLLNTILH